MALLDAKQIKNLSSKLPVRAVTTVALPANTYNNGTLGFGATLTEVGNGALPAIDGVTLVNGDRLLVKNEATGANNGIYVVTVIGTAGTQYVLTRVNDADTAVKTFAGIRVSSTADGTANGARGWILTTTGALTIGTTAQTWALETDSSSVVPTSSNKQMTASATTADFQVACATTIVTTPTSDGYVQIMVNGVQQVLGDGVKTKDCYFSVDGGTTARAISAITAGDTLYWVGSVASWQLATTDVIDFNYNV